MDIVYKGICVLCEKLTYDFYAKVNPVMYMGVIITDQNGSVLYKLFANTPNVSALIVYVCKEHNVFYSTKVVVK